MKEIFLTVNFIAGLSSIVFALSFIFKNKCRLLDRRIGYFFGALGLGFTSRIIHEAFGITAFAVVEGLALSPIIILIMLLVEALAKVDFKLWFKLFAVIASTFFFCTSFVKAHSHNTWWTEYNFYFEMISFFYIITRCLRSYVKTNVQYLKSVILGIVYLLSGTMLVVFHDYMGVRYWDQERLLGVMIIIGLFLFANLFYGVVNFSLRQLFGSIFNIFLRISIYGLLLKFFVPEITSFKLRSIIVLVISAELVYHVFRIILSSGKRNDLKLILTKITNIKTDSPSSFLKEILQIKEVQVAKILTYDELVKLDFKGFVDSAHELPVVLYKDDLVQEGQSIEEAEQQGQFLVEFEQLLFMFEYFDSNMIIHSRENKLVLMLKWGSDSFNPHFDTIGSLFGHLLKNVKPAQELSHD